MATTLTLSTPEEGYFFLLVSDGMGGHENGEQASEYTLKTLNQALEDGRIRGESFEDDLLRMACEGGGVDNISIILATLVE